MIQVECGGQPHELRDAIKKVWLTCHAAADHDKSTLNNKHKAHLISVACENPEDSGRPISSWPGWELAEEIKSRGIIDFISPRWVSELLRRADLRPHLNKYWLFSKDHRDPDHDEREVLPKS